MARMHSRKKGKSGSSKVYRNKPATWAQQPTKDIEALVVSLGKAGLSASQIGIQLRDMHGIPDVKLATGKKIGKILAEHNAAQELPDDLIALVKREVTILKHNEKHKHDRVGKRGQQLTESKIQRLAAYYKKTGKLPEDWKFNLEKAKLIVG